jgi:hypothetical protein
MLVKFIKVASVYRRNEVIDLASTLIHKAIIDVIKTGYLFIYFLIKINYLSRFQKILSRQIQTHNSGSFAENYNN